jgi:hypothetical protein
MAFALRHVHPESDCVFGCDETFFLLQPDLSAGKKFAVLLDMTLKMPVEDISGDDSPKMLRRIDYHCAPYCSVSMPDGPYSKPGATA